MIRVHHLRQSRSFRVIWLLEELGLPYDLVQYDRLPDTRLSPPSLEAVGAAGKAPMIEDDDLTLFESGAILDHIVRRHGGGRLAPDPASADYDRYQMWLHYAEGSAMLPVMIDLYARTRGMETPALRARLDGEIARHRGVLAEAVAGLPYILGDFTAADIQLMLPADVLDRLAPGGSDPRIADWLARLAARPAHARAIEIGGEPTMGGRR